MSNLVLPGIGGSGPAHWQSLWQEADTAARRFRPSSWDQPGLSDWISALERELEACAGPVVLVAHSLACLLVAHWAEGSAQVARVAGAFLVAPPDPDGADFPRAQAGSFAPVPTARLPFPALLVASRDDPYASIDYARTRAQQWGTGFVDVGEKGHINAGSGLGAWSEGQGLLAAFRAGLGLAGSGV
ncbi:alpha/beta hydrolase [Novosphingobium sp. YJ-S2-02]|uniref:Alpha/beta hydrolase n=1 Tax=Novosphingobium aureum TaxID=2792964 RepID=A0A931MJX3_9SPHN|nr:alpha/beta fold hydrolase [Novosphingobium aureum]MBH0112178.1 alpha/beta hydrolase [Novosphingobium aureum]